MNKEDGYKEKFVKKNKKNGEIDSRIRGEESYVVKKKV